VRQAVVKVAAATVREQIEAVLIGWGMLPELVAITADVMVDTDLAGIDSHGISMLMYYEDMLGRGELDLTARPAVVRDGPVTALVDARAGLGHPAGVLGMQLAVEKALALGVGVVAVANSHHFGATGYYAKLATDRGLLGFATSSGRTVCVVPTRAAVPRLATSPLAFAAPARRNPPFLLDMSTSTVAANKVKVYDFTGEPLPAGWVLDENGAPVTDAGRALEHIFERDVGGLAPLGGTPEMASHKGYGLNMMVQILAGTLSGGSFAPIREKRGDPDDIGHFFLAIDPTAFRPPGAFESDLDEAMDVLRDTPPIDPVRPVLVPGDPETAARAERLRDGIPLTDALVEKLRGVCERSGVPFLLG
jgi:LDH2 family malate/lactate/ureidoglycolate dehydrogenase